jgi:hypothetical protein
MLSGNRQEKTQNMRKANENAIIKIGHVPSRGFRVGPK